MVCCFFGLGRGESKGRTRIGRTRHRRGLCEVTLCEFKLQNWWGQRKHLCCQSTSAGQHQGLLLRKFEECKDLKKRIQNLAQSLVQVCSSCGSLANILGTAMDLHPKPCCGFFPPEVVYIRNPNREFTVVTATTQSDRTAWLHSVSINSADKDKGLFLRSSNGTWPQAPTRSRLHRAEVPVRAPVWQKSPLLCRDPELQP